METKTWITDDNGNRCSVEYWGSEEKAKEALASLAYCSECSECSGCTGCSYCSYCTGCSYCSYCSYCSGCRDCSDCRYCSEKNGIESLGDIPKIEDIHKKVFAAVSQPNALSMSDWHTCETTHCRAGWVVHLAGAAGYDLEKKTSAAFAAQQIYKASGYRINPSRFYDGNEAALEDMRKLAEEAK